MNVLIFIRKIRDAVLEILDVKLDRSFGMDISDRSIEILELKLGFRLSVLTYARLELESGIVEDGRILDKQKLVAKIKEALASVKPKKISTNKVVLSLPESKTFIYSFDIDSSFKKEQLRSEVFKEALKMIPFETQEVYWDFLARPSLINGRQTILYIGTLKNITAEYIEVCREVGLELTALDLESLSLARAILKTKRHSSVIVDLGARTTNILLCDQNNLLIMSVTVPIAGDHFTSAIALQLKIATQESEVLKKQWGIKEDPLNPVFSCLKEQMKIVVEEVKKAITFYENKTGDKVEMVYVAGGSSLLPDIDIYFQKELQLTVTLANPVKSIKLTQFLDQKINPILFANVIGLAMRGVSNKYKGINFLTQLSPELKKTPARFNLFTAGYLRKTTVIRHFLNNPFFVISSAIITFTIFGFVVYHYLYVPFYVMLPRQFNSITNQSAPFIELPDVSPPQSAQSTSTVALEESELLPVITQAEKVTVIIQKSPTDWVNIRSGPGVQFEQIYRVIPGEKYELLQEKEEWYKIKLSELLEGWVTSQYAKISK